MAPPRRQASRWPSASVDRVGAKSDGRRFDPGAVGSLRQAFWGKTPTARDWADPVNALILGAGACVALGYGFLRPGTGAMPDPAGLILVSVLVQPVLEEFFFRGFLQGELLARDSFRRRVAGISLANAAVAIAFAAAHVLHHPVEHALLVTIPSLIYGYSRERFDGVGLPIVQHATHNGFLIAALSL